MKRRWQQQRLAAEVVAAAEVGSRGWQLQQKLAAWVVAAAEVGSRGSSDSRV